MLSTKVPGVFRSRRRALSLLFAIVASVSFSVAAFAGTRIWIPVRWCGVEGAPSMDNPGTVNEATTDDVLWRRHERPSDAFYIPFADISFRAGATAAIKEGPQSFPIIRDPSGLGGILVESGENSDAVTMCRRAWMMGDPLYFDQNNNGTVNASTDTLLSTNSAVVGFVDLGHNGAMLKAVPGNVRFVDLDADGNFDIHERIYRDENGNNVVDAGDTLLVETSGTVVGNVDPADVAHALAPVPDTVKYVDLIRQPPNTFNIGYPAVQGVTGVNANDVHFPSIGFPVHGIAVPGLGQFGAAMDDASQYLPPGPDFTLFETQLVGHEFGHAFTLEHGDGNDDDMDGRLDDADDPTAPFPGAGPGTLCDSNNVMSYCWRDTGTAGNPTMEFIGIDGATSGIFTGAQSDKIRSFVLANMPDRIVDPVTPPLVAARVDGIGEIPSPSEHLDIAEFAAAIDASRSSSVLSLTTRRPFPIASTAVVDLHFLVDLDGNRETGLPASAAGVPSDFAGAEFVASVRLRGLRVESVVARRYDSQKREFEGLDPKRIKAIVETLEAIPDFPLDLRNTNPDGGGDLLRFPVAELVRVIVPAGLLALPTATAFRVEYLTVDVASGLIDSAKSPGMRFELPVFPKCRTEPEIVDRGDTATVFASGLLPDREVHLLLGADQVGSGHTDAAGSVRLALAIPAAARFGPRLVTVGALAVSADCSVAVRDPDAPPGKDEQSLFERCCRRFSIQFWILTGLVLIILIVVFIRKH